MLWQGQEWVQNVMQNSDNENARVEFEKVMGKVMIGLLVNQTELFKQFSDYNSFRKWISDKVFGLTYKAPLAIDSGQSL